MPELMVSNRDDSNMDLAFESEGLDYKNPPLLYASDTINLYDIPYEGRVQISYWDGGIWHTKPYFSPVLINPTWYAILKCARDGMIFTGDTHHCYLESVRIQKVEDELITLELGFGS